VKLDPGEFWFGGATDALSMDERAPMPFDMSDEEIQAFRGFYGPTSDERSMVGFPNFTYPEPDTQNFMDATDAERIAQGGGLFAASDAPLHPVTGRPMIRNPDGSLSSERGITVESDALNSGQPTNIPSIWDGRQLSEREAIERAIRSGQAFPHFGTIEEAVRASELHSRGLGLAAQLPPTGAMPDPQDILMQRALRAMLGRSAP